MITRLILIRHGTTAWNQQQRYCGCRDIGLSKAGRLQVRRLHYKLQGIKFEGIFSSDLKRAIQTAKIIFKDKKITKLRGLREINFGVIEGLRHSEILRIYGAAYTKWLKRPFRNHLPKAEQMGDFRRRVQAAISVIVRKSRGKTVAVVCHGGTIGVLVSSIVNKMDFWQYVPKAASVTVVESRNGKLRLIKFNDTVWEK
ncbi:MAG: histidine phosphatase family protein [Candidatus Omnitrophota bacterium]